MLDMQRVYVLVEERKQVNLPQNDFREIQNWFSLNTIKMEFQTVLLFLSNMNYYYVT